MEIKAPNPYLSDTDAFTVFLAGSIGMGTAEKWQDRIVSLLPEDWLILNPRRDDWDSSWVQEKTNPQFSEQVLWELDAQCRADQVLFYFDPNTKSPITLLELGLFYDKAIVCCPEGFWRKGNVDIVCDYYGIPQFETIEDMVHNVISGDRW